MISDHSDVIFINTILKDEINKKETAFEHCYYCFPEGYEAKIECKTKCIYRRPQPVMVYLVSGVLNGSHTEARSLLSYDVSKEEHKHRKRPTTKIIPLLSLWKNAALV